VLFPLRFGHRSRSQGEHESRHHHGKRGEEKLQFHFLDGLIMNARPEASAFFTGGMFAVPGLARDLEPAGTAALSQALR